MVNNQWKLDLISSHMIFNRLHDNAPVIPSEVRDLALEGRTIDRPERNQSPEVRSLSVYTARDDGLEKIMWPIKGHWPGPRFSKIK